MQMHARMLAAATHCTQRLGSRAFSAGTKISTGIVGLDVVPNAREVLTQLYARTLSDVRVMPESVFYRQSVEKFTRLRLDIVTRNTDVRSEGWLGGGA